MMGETKSDAVYRQTERQLQRLLAGDEAVVRGRLANLRRSAGTQPGDDPRVWGSLFADMPEEMLRKKGEPSWEEWAIHTALTLYAVHQQGNDLNQHNMNLKNESLGNAASRLVAKEGGDEDARERVGRRFHQIALAQDIRTMAYYLRSFIQLLRMHEIQLDYPELARDLYIFQTPEGAASIRLKWGEDFYRKVSIDNTENNSEGE